MATKKVNLDLDLHYAGWIAVDSGQAIVCDPVYLEKWNDDQKEEWNLKGREGEYSYQGAYRDNSRWWPWAIRKCYCCRIQHWTWRRAISCLCSQRL